MQNHCVPHTLSPIANPLQCCGAPTMIDKYCYLSPHFNQISFVFPQCLFSVPRAHPGLHVTQLLGFLRHLKNIIVSQTLFVVNELSQCGTVKISEDRKMMQATP